MKVDSVKSTLTVAVLCVKVQDIRERDITMFVAVGDIHGHYRQFIDLMAKLEEEVSKDVPHIFLGDYVDGGAHTNLVVDALRQYSVSYPHWVFLKGNHEDMMIDALLRNSETYGHYTQWYLQGGKETFHSYAPQFKNDMRTRISPLLMRTWIGDDVLSWLDNLPTLHETDEAIFVHGGLDTLNPQDTSEFSRLWLRDDFINSRCDWGKKVFFGHTPFEEPLVMPNKIGIDTMRHDFGKLTAAIVEGDNIEFIHSYST